MNSKYEDRKNFIINLLYFGLAAALVYISVKYVLGWLVPFIIGFFVALLLRPVIRFFSNRCHFPYKAAAIILALLFYAVVGILLALAGTKIVLVIQNGFASLPGIYTQHIEPLIRDIFARIQNAGAKFDPKTAQLIQNMTASFSDTTGTVVTGISTEVIRFLSSTILSLPSILIGTLLSVISSVFFAMDLNYIIDYVVKLMPEKARRFITRLRKIGAGIVIKYVKSYSILTSVAFVELSVGLLIFGVDNAFTIAALIAIIDLVPLIGAGGVLIPWIIIRLAQGDLTLSLELAILYGVMIVVRNILEPRILGKQIGIHPLAMLISMYVGLQVFGFAGIFVLPILLVMVKSYFDSRVAESSMPAEAADDLKK